jgi:hypothetical protein
MLLRLMTDPNPNLFDMDVCTHLYTDSQHEVSVYMDRAELIYPGSFRRMLKFVGFEILYPLGGPASIEVRILEHNPDLEIYVDHCSRAIEQTFPVTELNQHNPVTSEEIIRALTEVRLNTDAPQGEVYLPDNSPLGQALREFMPFVETATRIERRKQFGHEEEKADPDRLPGEICSMICSFLGTEQQRTLRREMMQMMTEYYIPLQRSNSVSFFNGNDHIRIFFDRALVLFPGQFRGVMSMRMRNLDIERTIGPSRYSPCLEDHLEHCCQTFEQLSRPIYLCSIHNTPWVPTVTDADIVQTLLDLQLDEVDCAEVHET